jgi:hypothetical protein
MVIVGIRKQIASKEKTFDLGFRHLPLWPMATLLIRGTHCGATTGIALYG